MEGAWSHAHHFELYDDALPALAELRQHGLRIGLLSNSARDLDAFVSHHALTADAVLTSVLHGKTKPHETIFRRMLELLDVEPGEAVMVGDTLEDDIEGARAVGMQALLVDREGRYPELESLAGLRALSRALGLD
jgi:putative hydrolase of the HAD superfamily